MAEAKLVPMHTRGRHARHAARRDRELDRDPRPRACDPGGRGRRRPAQLRHRPRRAAAAQGCDQHRDRVVDARHRWRRRHRHRRGDRRAPQLELAVAKPDNAPTFTSWLKNVLRSEPIGYSSFGGCYTPKEEQFIHE